MFCQTNIELYLQIILCNYNYILLTCVNNSESCLTIKDAKESKQSDAFEEVRGNLNALSLI